MNFPGCHKVIPLEGGIAQPLKHTDSISEKSDVVFENKCLPKLGSVCIWLDFRIEDVALQSKSHPKKIMLCLMYMISHSTILQKFFVAIK